jgi:hypothetical protein
MANKDVDFGRLAEELEERFSRGVDWHWSSEDFGALALATFRCQFETVRAFQALCRTRGLTPATVEGWEDVPAVPARAFKHIDFAVTEPELVFLTSGTTRGPELRGRHLVPKASLYRASLLPPFEKHLIGSGARPMRFLSLIPSADELPGSSLSYMVSTAAEAFASETLWLVDGAGALDVDRLRTAIREVGESGAPVLLLGTALALLHAVEGLEGEPCDSLPAGSRVMETGGFKGLDREVGRDELYDRIGETTGVPRERIVSEYGMTELLSQLYTPVLSEGPEAAGEHAPPPWLKIRALDPVTLEEVAPGEPGLLAFFDLANAGSVCHVLTEDIGSMVNGRVRLQGRLRGAEPRGCSRAMDELMSSRETVL